MTTEVDQGPVKPVQIGVLGRLKVTDRNGTTVAISPRIETVVALLVAAGPDGITARSMAIEIWDNDPPSSWASSIRNYITRLRADIGTDAITRQSGRYRLSGCDIDSWLLLETAATLDHNFDEPLVQRLLSR